MRKKRRIYKRFMFTMSVLSKSFQSTFLPPSFSIYLFSKFSFYKYKDYLCLLVYSLSFLISFEGSLYHTSIFNFLASLGSRGLLIFLYLIIVCILIPQCLSTPEKTYSLTPNPNGEREKLYMWGAGRIEPGSTDHESIALSGEPLCAYLCLYLT